MSFIEDLISAAESGDAEAQLSLGYCYDTGDGVKKSYKKAVFWYTKAAEQGNVDAQYNFRSLLQNRKRSRAFSRNCGVLVAKGSGTRRCGCSNVFGAELSFG